MAYSATNAGSDEGDDSIFSSGGAIMDALGGKDPSEEEDKKSKKASKESKSKPVKKQTKKTITKKALAKK
jgi:hypothetical protein